jgi:phosphoglycerate dehydrogenase-like enzyme
LPTIVLYPQPAPDVVAIAERLLPPGFTLEIAGPGPELAPALSGAEFLTGFIGPLPDEAWQAARGLRLIQLLSAGYDNFPIEQARRLGVPVATNGGANALAVAEHAVMLMLAVYRHLPALDRQVRAGTWLRAARGDVRYHELGGKRVGILGMGRIGQRVAHLVRAFDAEVFYSDVRRLPADAEARLGALFLSLDALLDTVDVLSIHLPLLPETRGIIGERELALLAPGSILVNTARGELVDEAALYRT